MTFLDRLERRFAPFAIPGLIRYVVILNALVFLLVLVNPAYVMALVLDPQAIMAGQVWRVVSWIFIPGTSSILWMFCYMSFTWWLGDSLEATWGTFRLNLYYLLGIVGCVVAALFLGGWSGGAMLNVTLLFAAATMAPNLEILLFYILPLKLKFLGIFSALYPAYLILFGPIGVKVGVLVCLANYFLFFGPALFRQARQNREVGVRRARFDAAQHRAPEMHRCSLCGITEITNPRADFRVADDDKEYCMDHLPPARR